jgi:hypothetical protein
MIPPYELLAVFILSTPGLLLALLFQFLSPPLIRGGPKERRKYRHIIYLLWTVLTTTAAVMYLFLPAVTGLLLAVFAGMFLFQDARLLLQPAARRARANLRAQRSHTEGLQP